MAKSDGSIKIKAEIDNSQIPKDLQELNKMVADGAVDEKTALEINKLATSWNKYRQELEMTERKQLELADSVGATNSKLEELKNTLSADTTTEKKLAEEIRLRRENIANLREQLRLERTGAGKAPIREQIIKESESLAPDIEKYNKLQESIRNTREEIIKTGTEAQELEDALVKSNIQGEALEHNMQKVGVSSSDLTKKMKDTADGVENVNVGLKEANINARNMGTGMNKGIKSLMKYAGALLGVRSIYLGLRKAMNAWTNSTVEGAQAAADLEAIWQSIGQALAPVFEYLIKLLRTILGYMNAITQILFGITLFGKTTAKNAKNTAKSMGGAVKDAKKLNKEMKQLAGFDEMNILSAEPDTGGGGGGGGGPLLPTEIVAPDLGNFKDAVDKMKQWVKDIWESETMQSYFDSFTRIGTNSFNMIKEVGANLWDNLMLDMEVILPHLETGFFNIIELYRQMFEDIADFTDEWFPVFTESLNSFIDGIFSTFRPLKEFMAKLWADVTGIMLKTWQEYGEPLLDEVGKFINGLIETFELIWTKIIDPIITPAIEEMTRIWDEHLKDVVAEVQAFIMELITGALRIWNEVISPIINWLVEKLAPVFEWIGKHIIPILGDAIGTTVDIVGTMIRTLRGIFGGLIDFITGVFTGDWELAWKGVTKIFNSVWDGLKEMVKAPLNFIIRQVNKLFKGFNKLKVPSWVPIIGGRGFSFQPIQQLARGGITTGATTAEIGEAGREVVLPLEKHTGWAEQLLDVLDSYGGLSGGQGTIINNIHLDGREIAKYIIDLMEERNLATNGRMRYGN